MMELWPHQKKAVKAFSDSFALSKTARPLIDMWTGTGKSLVQADLGMRIQQAGKRAVFVTDTEELIEQNYAEMLAHGVRDCGIFCAGLGRKDVDTAITVASIKSIYNSSDKIQPVDYIFIDECHMLSTKSDSMYQKFINYMTLRNPNTRVGGLTASIYRLDQGTLLDGDNAFFTSIPFKYGYTEALNDGYAVPLVSAKAVDIPDMHDVKLNWKGDFDDAEAGELFIPLIPSHAAQLIEYAKVHQKMIVFCQNIKHARLLSNAIGNKISHAFVDSKTGKTERKQIIKDHKTSDMQLLINVGIATKGYDVKSISFVGLIFSTKSVSKLIQTSGRGARIFDGKTHCEIADWGGNFDRLGPIDQLDQRKPGDGVAPVKECPDCPRLLNVNKRFCECGHDFGPPPEKKIGKDLTKKAAEGGITSKEPIKIYVDEIKFSVEKSESVGEYIRASFYDMGRFVQMHNMFIESPYKFQRAKGIKDFIMFCQGMEKKINGLGAEIVVTALNNAYEKGVLKKPDFINVVPQKKKEGKKQYYDVIDWGNQDGF